MRQWILGRLAATVSSRAQADLGEQYAPVLVEMARSRHIDARASGARVTLAGVELNLHARIEGERQEGPQWFVGVAVHTELPDGVRLTMGLVGAGATRQDALQNAVENWAMLAGVAILGGVALKERSDGVIARNGLILYPGLLGFRGPAPAWSDDLDVRLVELITPTLMGLAAGRLHDVSLAVNVDPTGDVDGDCRVDGALSPSVLNAVKAFSWPKLKTSYMFKRYYVVDKAR